VEFQVGTFQIDHLPVKEKELVNCALVKSGVYRVEDMADVDFFLYRQLPLPTGFGFWILCEAR
jgi:hypothetical protein